jgi:hypothetical protein
LWSEPGVALLDILDDLKSKETARFVVKPGIRSEDYEPRSAFIQNRGKPT